MTFISMAFDGTASTALGGSLPAPARDLGLKDCADLLSIALSLDSVSDQSLDFGGEALMTSVIPRHADKVDKSDNSSESTKLLLT